MNPNDIINAVKTFKNAGYSATDIDSWLQSKGSSLQEASAFNQYGADNVARARNAITDVKTQQESEFRPIAATGRFFGENPVGRGITSVIQGVNKGNPFVQGASLIPGLDKVNDNVIEPETGFERALDLGAQFATPAGITAKGLGLAAKGIKGATKAGRVAKALLTPAAMPVEMAGAAGAGALTGAINPESTAGQIATALAGGVTGAGFASAVNRGAIGVGKNFIGQIDLSDALRDISKGRSARDIDFGRVTKAKIDEINSVPGLADNVRMENNRIFIPAEKVQHIYDSRIAGNNMSRKQVIDTLQNVFHGKNATASSGGNPYSVMMSNTNDPSGYGILLPNYNKTGQNAIDTVIRDNPKRVQSKINRNNSRLDGRSSPSSSLSEDSPGTRFSSVQPASTLNIAQNPENVNQNIINALTDNNKTRKLVMAVQSGEDDIAQTAGNIVEDLTRKQASGGKANPAFNDSIKTPELRKAQQNYDDFITKNRDLPVDLDDFYKNNPVAVGVIDEARNIDPTSFVGVKPGSFEEAQLLKQKLHDKVPIDASSLPAGTTSAYKNAEASLKNKMEAVVPGFRDLDRQYARAKTTQDIYEKLLRRNASKVANATNSPFWSGLSSPITAAGLVGGTVNPIALVRAGAGLAGKSILRSSRRNVGRQIANTGDYATVMQALSGAAPEVIRNAPKSATITSIMNALSNE